MSWPRPPLDSDPSVFFPDLGREEILLWWGGVEELRRGRCWGNGSLDGAPRSPRSCRVPGRRDQSGAAAISWLWPDRVKAHLAAVQVWLPRCEACSRMPLSRCHLSTMLRDHSSGSLDNHASLDRTPGPIERRPAFGGPFVRSHYSPPPPADHSPHHLATLWNSELGIFSNIRTLAPAVRCIDPVRRHSLTAMNDGGHPSTADRRPLRTIYPPPWPRPGRCHWILAGASSEPYTSSLIDI